MKNRQVLLKSYPQGKLTPAHFELSETNVPELKDNEFLLRNHILSLDAGFRQWMNAGSGDNYLTAMALGAPVMSIVIGEIVKSNNSQFPVGQFILARTAWEEYSIGDGSDIATPLDMSGDVPISLHAGMLGPTGMTAYFGMVEIGDVKKGDEVLISAAAGAVGAAAGQIARIKGARVVGMASTDDKCQWLTNEVGFDDAFNYKDPAGLEALIEEKLPNGIDVFFDNVGGPVLDAAMGHLREFSRIVLCGQISSYNADGPMPGPSAEKMWELITKRTTMRGYMFSDYMDKAPDAFGDIVKWLQSGELKNFDQITDGVENTAQAFCDMLDGKNRGKALVRLVS